MIDKSLIDLLITSLFAFIIGLEIKTYYKRKKLPLIGSTRTMLFLGIIGFLTYKISLYFYLAFFVVFGLLYLAYYIKELQNQKTTIILFLVATIVYTFGPINIYFPFWMDAIIFVIIIFTLNYKKYFTFYNELNEEEFETLAKFVLLSGVILPILPKEKIPYLDISYFKIWLVVVVVSGISYGSYIASKYIFKNKGFLLTGILGGLYSSTATTVVLAKKSKNIPINIINASIIIATSMMYLRLLVISFIFNKEVTFKLLIPFLTLSAISAVIAFIFYKKENQTSNESNQNPLELSTAFVFALLFVIMIAITKFVVINFGNLGLQILSFIVGFTDIDPFILSLLTGKFHHITTHEIVSAIIIASGSNDILKALYAYIFGEKLPIKSALALLLLGIGSIIYIII